MIFLTHFYLKSAIQTKDVIREETHFGVAHHIYNNSSDSALCFYIFIPHWYPQSLNNTKFG